MKKQFFPGLISICMLLFSHNATAQDDVNNYSYTGYVFDRHTKQPLAGARITITFSATNKVITNTTSGRAGAYYVRLQQPEDIKVVVNMSGYKKEQKNFSGTDLKKSEFKLPAIYLDTIIKIEIKPAVPVKQSKEEYIGHQLAVNNILPGPAAYDLLLFLNPDLKNRDSLMSNDNIVLPKMPIVPNKVKKNNKTIFQDDKRYDRATQNRLRDSLDKLARILGDDIAQYKIKFENLDAGTMNQIRDYMRMDVMDFGDRISKTSKLKAEGLIELLGIMIELHQKMIVKKALPASEYMQMKLVWADLSYLLQSSRYMLFSNRRRPVDCCPGSLKDFVFAGTLKPVTPGNIHLYDTVSNKEAYFYEDEVGAFGFVVWGENITSPMQPNLGEPSDRYVIRYFKPAFADNKNAYKLCSRNANVALANLNRAKYGVEVYDTKEKKYAETLYPYFSTDEAFTERRYDALLIPDFKEIKYILIRLK